jgi:hypothetical protein
MPKKRNNTVITIIAAIIAFSIDYYFKGTIDNSIGVIIFCIAVFLVVYFHLYLTIDQEDLDYKQEFYNSINHKTIEIMSEEQKPKPSSWASTDSKPAYFDKETPKEEKITEVKAEELKPEMPKDNSKDDQKERLEDLKAANENSEKDNSNDKSPIKDNNNAIIDNKTPIISKGIRSYSLHNVNKRYRAMFDDMCSFSVNNGVKPEQMVIDHFRKYGYPLDIKRPENEPKGLIAFNLGFLRIPMEGFFEVA